MNPPALPTLRRVKRIAPLQLGKMAACLFGAVGLLFVPYFLMMGAGDVSIRPDGVPAGMGVGSSLCLPLIYAAVGFVSGVIGAAIYNVLAKWIGGIEVEVE